MIKKTGKEPPDKKLLEEFSKKLKPLVSTNKDLADKTGISETMIGKYVTGQALPRCDLLLEISKAVNKSMEFLLTGEERLEKSSPQISNSDPMWKHFKEVIEENVKLKEKVAELKRKFEWDGKTERRKASGT